MLSKVAKVPFDALRLLRMTLATESKHINVWKSTTLLN
jgi:hypothetical protein